MTDDSITIENALATSVLKWRVVERVVRGPDVWLFFLGRGQLDAVRPAAIADPAFMGRTVQNGGVGG